MKNEAVQGMSYDSCHWNLLPEERCMTLRTCTWAMNGVGLGTISEWQNGWTVPWKSTHWDAWQETEGDREREDMIIWRNDSLTFSVSLDTALCPQLTSPKTWSIDPIPPFSLQ